jgi:hypothetical protein
MTVECCVHGIGCALVLRPNRLKMLKVVQVVEGRLAKVQNIVQEVRDGQEGLSPCNISGSTMSSDQLPTSGASPSLVQADG